MKDYICSCECHREDIEMMHMQSCCDLCGEKYINKDGFVDIIKYNNAIHSYNFMENSYHLKELEKLKGMSETDAVIFANDLGYNVHVNIFATLLSSNRLNPVNNDLYLILKDGKVIDYSYLKI